jgi:hypothetical protein
MSYYLKLIRIHQLYIFFLLFLPVSICVIYVYKDTKQWVLCNVFGIRRSKIGNKEFLGIDDLRGKPTEYYADSILTSRSKSKILLFRFRIKFGMTIFMDPDAKHRGI